MQVKQGVKRALGIAGIGSLVVAGPALGADDQEVGSLKQRVDTLEQRLEATAQMLEQQGGQAADGGRGTTSIGGYGELHYNNWDSMKMMDFHRFVLFFGHQFNDWIHFDSEVELEHAYSGEGKPGAVELEQAYVSFDIKPAFNAKAGLFLVPVGILNETHEPNTFYGVERNPVEANIIPTTWWEGGGAAYGELAPGWRYDFTVTSGLNVSNDGDADDYLIRGGRQKVAKAEAEDLAYTGRIKWTGMPGVELAATGQYQEDVTQGSEGVSATLLEAHAAIRQGPFGLRALYAQWSLDGNGPEAVGRDEQTGWYIEPSVKLTEQVGVFARFNQWDNSAGSGSSTDTELEQTKVGVNYWPHPDVVLKADYQAVDGNDDDGYNLGVGYQF